MTENSTASVSVQIIGGGLAGCEAAWQLATWGREVILFEQKPCNFSPAHRNPDLAELVCSNSLKSESMETAHGLLKAELRALQSLIISAADVCRVPAGTALAVERERFSGTITERIRAHERIHLIREEVSVLSEHRPMIIATGPLTSAGLTAHLLKRTGESSLYFYDAISPIIDADSIDQGEVFRASRYGKGEDDYVNCPMDKETYRSFHEALLASERFPLRSFETPIFFQGCKPIEDIAGSGFDALAYGPMKPVGLIDPRRRERPYAVVQLRSENKSLSAYSLVGFQTRMTIPEQKRVFSLIPGLAKARFLRFGSVHRNTFFNSPELLNADLQLKSEPGIFLAGQITGVEGYIESVACGLVAAYAVESFIRGQSFILPPRDTAMGALMAHLQNRSCNSFQPTNIHYGLFQAPPQIYGRKNLRNYFRENTPLKIIDWRNEREH